MLANFRAYQLAKEFYKSCSALKYKGELGNQFERATLSVVLNIAEGSNQPTLANKRKFFAIALGSLRESQAILDILDQTELLAETDELARVLYRLVNPRRG